MSLTARKAGKLALVFALAQICICPATWAQDGELASTETVEEIVVIGEKSLTRLRHEFYGAKEDFFDAFNALNGNDELDVDCDYVSFLGDRRRHHLCMPRFAEKAEADSTISLMLGGKLDCAIVCNGHWSDSYSNSARLRASDEQLRKAMVALMTEHPALRETFSEMRRAKQVYESEREKR